MNLNFNVKGPERKKLVIAVSDIINAAVTYKGAPTYAFHVGDDYIVDREGTLTGPENFDLVFGLLKRGFEAEATDTAPVAGTNVTTDTAPVADTAPVKKGRGKKKGKGIMDCLVDALNENADEGEQWTRLHSTPTMECGDGRWRNLDGTFTGSADTASDAAPVADVAPESADQDNTAPVSDAAPDADNAPGAAKADKRDLPRLYTLDTPRGEIFIAEEFATHDEAAAEGYGEYFSTALGTVYSYNDDRTFALVTSRKAGAYDTTKIKRDFREAPPTVSPVVAAMMEPMPEAPPAETPDDDQIVIEYPLDGFAPDKLENLRKLVDSKAVVIMKAIGADNLPIHIEGDQVVFPWFKGNLDGDTVNAYALFVAALCESAKRKTRIVAKGKDNYENEKFTMHVFMNSLKMLGPEYRLIRKLLQQPLDGSLSVRYGGPSEKKADTDAPLATGTEGM